MKLMAEQETKAQSQIREIEAEEAQTEAGLPIINRITMQGFKSFNRKVSVPLIRGFNVFCGPNGVGKSNIVDAVCFVLGRTSAKSMRAGRLHELIYHGGEGKGGSKQAVVTLYIDNAKRTFSYDEDEISITRKVNNKGVSVYKLNGRTTTRSKIVELLAGARIQPDGHNIVLQGDITGIIEMNPVQRRGLIDEISGIAEYNDKKEKAGKDLEKVDQKLREAEILITERYERFKRLEDERNAAIRFQSLQKQLELLRASLAHKKMTEYEDKTKKLDEELKEKEEQIEKASESIDKLEAEVGEREESMRDIADKLINMSKHVDEEKRVSQLRSNMLIHQNEIEAGLREIDRLTALIDRLEVMESTKMDPSGLPRPTQAVLAQNFRGVQGVVRDLMRVPEQLQVAIEVAAGNHIFDIVVDNDDVAKFCIDFLKRERIGRAAFIPLNKIRPHLFKDSKVMGQEGVLGVASRLVKYDSSYMNAMEFVLGNTLIVEDLEVAQRVGIGKARMVTLGGDLVERSGAMIGGHFMRANRQTMSKTISGEIEGYRNGRKKLMKDVEILKNELAEMEKKLQKMTKSEDTKKVVDMQKLKVSSEREMEDLRGKRRAAYDRKMKLQNAMNRISIDKARIEADMENVKIELDAYGEMEYVDDTVHSLQKMVFKASEEIKGIGAVNLRAIEEYDAFRSQFDEYKKKYEKILEEKQAVMGMIEEIEQRRLEVFYDCLKIVSRHFNRLFNKMTNGLGSLELEDPSNIESGLMIRATPKGKRPLNIDSMSGGEKTLTALAFIFAIQKYRPAPFYILDEIDAALDKENSQKIADLIKDLSQSEQFIVITHNDQTIKSGERVFGITMDRGESKILGIELPS